MAVHRTAKLFSEEVEHELAALIWRCKTTVPDPGSPDREGRRGEANPVKSLQYSPQRSGKAEECSAIPHPATQRRMARFFETYGQHGKLAEVASTLSEFRGCEEWVFRDLVRRYGHPEPPNNDAMLPVGWAAVCTSRGDIFYRHSKTGAKQWDRPR